MRKQITKRQKQALDFITKFKDNKGYAPSLEEISKHLGLSSVSTAHHHVNALEEEGYLVRGENTPRAIAVKEINKLIRIPLLGTISAGTPIEAVEEKETIEIPKLQLSKGGKHFALRVKGNSIIV